jgi:pimeloyl-ACP methyl ester carboxylesterase
MWAARVEHIRRFLELQGIEKAHFAGSSMGAGMLLVVASMDKPLWPIDKIVIANGGGEHVNNESRQVLTSYDCSREHMRKMVHVLFHNPKIRNDENYIERRYQLSLEPGAWECTAAPRFRSPVVGVRAGALPMDYEKIKAETLLIYGARDSLREPDFGEYLHGRIPGSTLQIFQESGHFPQIDEAEKFNRAVIEFLR